MNTSNNLFTFSRTAPIPIQQQQQPQQRPPQQQPQQHSFNASKARIENGGENRRLANDYYDNIQDPSSESEEVDLEYIIKNKPKTKVVREFFRDNLNSIKSEEELLFNL